jgi:hypothetical protein
MKMMAPTRPAELHACCVHLSTGLATAPEARGQLRADVHDTSCGLPVQAGAARVDCRSR